MAEIVVNLVIENLGPLLVQEIKLLGGVKRQVGYIKRELESIRCFLKDADARAAAEEEGGGGVSNEGVKSWVKQVREEAYRIEDVIDEYIFTVARLPHGGLLSKISRSIKIMKLRYDIAAEIKDIKSSLADIHTRREFYGISSIEQASSTETRNVTLYRHGVDTYFIGEDDVVGIESSRDKLINNLLANGGLSKPSVIAVVGEGGIGKTTLAWKVYNNQVVKDHFSYHAWITIGKAYIKEDLLRTMIKEFKCSTTEEIDTMDEMKLTITLATYLQDKSYLIVFDDVWKIEFWGDVKHALLHNNKNSKIVLTTRGMDIANACQASSIDQVYNLPHLPSDKAWELFCKKAFKFSSDGCCPPELEELSHCIVEKCAGLPLAIAVIGGLLSTKNKVISEWEKLLNNLGSKLKSDPHLQSYNRVLCESYQDLPPHLKSCLLYFGLFPEGCLIRCGRLTRHWIVEGFVPYSKCPTPEQVAEEYLIQLVDRCLVQVSDRYFCGRPRLCRVHDLLHEVILRKAKEFGFCMNGEDLSQNWSKTRRISINKSVDGVSNNTNGSKIRSLLLFEVNELPNSFMNMFATNFKLMKTLDLEDAPIEYLPEGVGNLFHLQYLSVRNTKVKALPKSIGKLLNLETLNMKHTPVSELPIEIKNLKKLRHLLACH